MTNLFSATKTNKTANLYSAIDYVTPNYIFILAYLG